MKYFVVSDVHSFFKEMMAALHEKGFEIDNQEHKLIVCGDLFDRGDETVQLFKFIKEMHAQGRLIYIKGNHEDLLFDCVNELKMGSIPSHHHFHNGTVKTICQFCVQNEWIIYDREWRDRIIETMQPILDFINDNCVDYAEIEDYIFVHGWVPCTTADDNIYHARKKFGKVNEVWNNPDDPLYAGAWKAARWINGMEAWKQGCYIPGKTIVMGHWHCSWGWSHLRQERKEWPQFSRKDWKKSFEPFVDDGIIAIDACTAYSGLVNVLVIE